MPSSPTEPHPHERKTPTPISPAGILTLYLQNLRTMRDWYKAAPGRGIEVGHHMVGELSAGDNAAALEAALDGKTWQPPSLPHE